MSANDSSALPGSERKPTLIANEKNDLHVVTLSGRGPRRVFVLKNAKRAAKLALAAIHEGRAKRAECVTLRPWSDGRGFGRVGTMTVTPPDKRPADVR